MFRNKNQVQVPLMKQRRDVFPTCVTEDVVLYRNIYAHTFIIHCVEFMYTTSKSGTDQQLSWYSSYP